MRYIRNTFISKGQGRTHNCKPFSDGRSFKTVSGEMAYWTGHFGEHSGFKNKLTGVSEAVETQ